MSTSTQVNLAVLAVEITAPISTLTGMDTEKGLALGWAIRFARGKSVREGYKTALSVIRAIHREQKLGMLPGEEHRLLMAIRN